jgi:hypothetical protein
MVAVLSTTNSTTTAGKSVSIFVKTRRQEGNAPGMILTSVLEMKSMFLLISSRSAGTSLYFLCSCPREGVEDLQIFFLSKCSDVERADNVLKVIERETRDATNDSTVPFH